jgi:hypothetical protein
VPLVGFHAFAPLDTMRVTNDIPLGCSFLLPVHTVNCVHTLKGRQAQFAADVLVDLNFELG